MYIRFSFMFWEQFLWLFARIIIWVDTRSRWWPGKRNITIWQWRRFRDTSAECWDAVANIYRVADIYVDVVACTLLSTRLPTVEWSSCKLLDKLKSLRAVNLRGRLISRDCMKLYNNCWLSLTHGTQIIVHPNYLLSLLGYVISKEVCIVNK